MRWYAQISKRAAEVARWSILVGQPKHDIQRCKKNTGRLATDASKSKNKNRERSLNEFRYRRGGCKHAGGSITIQGAVYRRVFKSLWKKHRQSLANSMKCAENADLRFSPDLTGGLESKGGCGELQLRRKGTLSVDDAAECPLLYPHLWSHWRGFGFLIHSITSQAYSPL